MGFDADAYRAARIPWTFTANGQTFTARSVSVDQVQRFQQDVEGGKETEAVATLLRVLFPWRPHYVWRVDQDPMKVFQKMDRQTQIAALTDFFGYLAGTARPASPPIAETHGTGWQPPTEIHLMAPEPPAAA